MFNNQINWYGATSGFVQVIGADVRREFDDE